jgi:pilus assembly protein Flp/PilA
MSMRRAITQFVFENDGATAVEYAVMLALVLITVLVSIGAVGSQAGGWWGGIKANLQTVGFGT